MFWILFAIGFILRSYQFGSQILWCDEWHAVFNIRDFHFWSNATSYRESDNCAPLTAFYQILTHTTGLNEFGMRLPLFLAGLFIIIFCYWFVKKVFDKNTALIFTALIAISPLLIHYSRYARPYSIVSLLTFVAVAGFYAWIKTGNNVYARVYVATAVLAPYFHLYSLPAVVAPWCVSFCLSLYGNKEQMPASSLKVPSMGRLLKMGMLVVLGIGVWFIPMLRSLGHVTNLVQKDHIVANTLPNMLCLFSGTSNYFITSIMIILFIYGMVCLYRMIPFLCSTIMTILLLQCILILVTMPAVISVGIVLARYSISLLLFWLLAIAVALNSISSRLSYLKTRKTMILSLPFISIIALIFILFLKGPIPAAYYSPNNFTNHHDFQYFYRNRPFQLSDPTLSTLRFYNSLKPQRSVHTIVEYPAFSPQCMYGWEFNPYHTYQKIHGKKVIMGETHESCAGLVAKGIRLNYLIDITDKNSWIKRAQYLVVHKNILNEIMTLRRDSHLSINNQRFFTPDYYSKMAGTLLELKNIYGQPVYEDEYISVFKSNPAQE